MNHAVFSIEVVYATADKQITIPLKIQSKISISEAIKISKILDLFPTLDLKTLSVGIWGKPKFLEDFVASGDRVEIYRPLLIDPIEARRLRVVKKKAERKS